MDQREDKGDDVISEATATSDTTVARATAEAKVDTSDEMNVKEFKYEDQGARPRTFAPKGERFEIDKASKQFTTLKNLSKTIIDMVDQKQSFDFIRAKHSLWMDKYESFLEHHQNIIPRIHPDNKETYIETFNDRNTILRTFITSMNNYFNAANQDLQRIERDERRSRSSRYTSHASRASSSRVTSTRSLQSSISSKRLKEEQTRAELEAKMAALTKKKEIELAKMNIKLEEEELEIRTNMAISNAKQKVLDKYESEIESVDSYKCSTEKSSKKLGDRLYTENRIKHSSLNVHAEPYTPKHDRDIQSSSNVDNVRENGHIETMVDAITKPIKQTVDNYLIPQVDNYTASYRNDKCSDLEMSSIVKHLRKPVADIRKFGGDPLEFRKFIRQFTARIVVNAETEDEKMTYLEQFTYGEANRVVSGFGQLTGEHAYTSAMKQLQERYGDEEVIANAFIKKALGWSDIASGDSKALDEFSLFLIECLNAIESIDAIRILEYSENIKLLLKKLPMYLHDRWRNVVSKIRDKKHIVKFSDFVEFVKTEAKKLNDPVYGKAAVTTNSQNSRLPKTKTQKAKEFTKGSFAAEIKPETPKLVIDQKCSYCGKNHSLENCKDILKLSINERYEHLKGKGHCFGCLKVGHRTANCRNRLTCKACHKRHPTLLHNSERQQESTTKTTGSTQTERMQDTNSITSSTQSGAGKTSCAMAIIPVKVKLRDKPAVIDTYAFFDSGSSVSLCTEDLLHRLGGSGKRMNIKLNTMGKPFNMNTYAVTGLQVMDYDMKNVVNLPKVYTKGEMPVSSVHIPKEDEISNWSHLSKIRWHSPDCGIGLMIGNNVPDAYMPIEIATGPSGSPHATRTRLGWIIWNMLRDFEDSDQVVNRAQLMSIQSLDEDDSRLEQLFRNSMNYDFPERIVDDKRESSVEDKKFLELVNESVDFKNGHYEIGLPFRDAHITFPNNASQCIQRLKGLKIKFARNPKFKADYIEFMNKLIDKDYMEIVPLEDLDRNDGRVWYLPHHGVYHAQKDKIRVVFDCSATYLGASLNSQLLQGPNLTNNLLTVLFRFREEHVAILGDIEAMFHQVRVPRTDRDCLRFFWWPNGNVDGEPVEYRMTVHLFGATSSPSCCNFALNHAIEDFGHKYDPSISQIMTDSMYVDDCLASVETEDKAINAIRDVTSLCKDGGFKMTKWISNAPYVIQSIPEDDRAKGVQHWSLEDGLPVERALGVQWNMATDCLGFKVTFKDKPACRRIVLSITSSIFDLIGIVSPFLLTAKLILQRLCKYGYSWDQELTGVELKQWNEWLSQLSDLESIRLPRCYKPVNFGHVKSCQLHCFSDASETGYGMVFYLRMIDNSDQINCAFVLGKSRVTPLKKITIPRLELTAAAKAVKLSKIIVKEINYTIDKIIFWTDSMSVVRYIYNQKSRFHTFVANRLEVIQEATKPEQWKYVNTKINPADYASRGMKASNFATNSDWLYGANFLRQHECEWPEQEIDKSISNTDYEVKEVVNTVVVEPRPELFGKLMTNFSDWTKLKRVVCRLLTFFDLLKRNCNKNRTEMDINIGTITIDMLKRSEKCIIRFVQRQHFADEINSLRSDPKKVLKRTSKLYKLDPFLDCDCVLRIGGRLDRSELPYDAKHPIILPKDSNVSILIINYIHRSIGHLGRNSILSELRKRYWIISASSIIKGLISKCVICKRYQGPLLEQKMSDLPTERLTPDKPAFSIVGVDFFGPLYIKQRRSTVKRYGMIFTCMSVRAVHLEIVHSMDTDSCINAIRRFIARRGVPEFIRSDNGTNLIGAEREMREEIFKWNAEKINSSMTQQGIRWEFNPPAASHFGGVWERLIRSVRKILYSVIKEQNIRLDDEGLMTFMCEVESILNNRPLTDVSESPNDTKVLTPNHLLLLRPGEYFPPGTFCKTDNYVKRRWRQIQYLTDLFWRRWTSEYIPLLQRRQKWIVEKRNVKVGDIVIIHDNCPRNFWNLGRVVEVFMDNVGSVRSAKVKTATSILTRPITKLCMLVEND